MTCSTPVFNTLCQVMDRCAASRRWCAACPCLQLCLAWFDRYATPDTYYDIDPNTLSRLLDQFHLVRQGINPRDGRAANGGRLSPATAIKGSGAQSQLHPVILSPGPVGRRIPRPAGSPVGWVSTHHNTGSRGRP